VLSVLPSVSARANAVSSATSGLRLSSRHISESITGAASESGIATTPLNACAAIAASDAGIVVIARREAIAASISGGLITR
jgi:hypothetical protein